MAARAIIETMCWRRLDVEGHDACRLTVRGDGARLEGTTVFRDVAGPAALTYVVDCDRAWRCVGARVTGFVGAVDVDVIVACSAADGVWCANGVAFQATRGAVDVD